MSEGIVYQKDIVQRSKKHLKVIRVCVIPYKMSGVMSLRCPRGYNLAGHTKVKHTIVKVFVGLWLMDMIK